MVPMPDLGIPNKPTSPAVEPGGIVVSDLPPCRHAPVQMDTEKLKAVQKSLRDLGFFEVGKVDGLWGTRTIGALAAFQAHCGLPVTVTEEPVIDADTLMMLAIASPRTPSAERRMTTVADLKAQGSTTVKKSLNINWSQYLQIGVAVAETVVQAYHTYQGVDLPFGSGIMMQAMGLPAWVGPLAQFGLALYTIAQSNGVLRARLNAEISGMHNGEPDPAPSPPVETQPEPLQGLTKVFRGGK